MGEWMGVIKTRFIELLSAVHKLFQSSFDKKQREYRKDRKNERRRKQTERGEERKIARKEGRKKQRKGN